MSLLIEQATKMHKKRQYKTSESLKCLKTRLFLKSKLNQKAKISYQHFVRNSNENNKQISIQADLSCFCPLPKLVSDSILKVILTQDHKVQLKTVIASNRLPLCVRSTAAKVQLLKHLSDLSSRQNILNKCSRSLIKIDRQTGEISTRFTIQLSLILFNLFPSILFDKLASIISSACNEIVSNITNCLSFLNLIRRSKKHSRFFFYKQVISRFLAPSTISENQQSQKTSSYSQKNIDNSSIPCYLINNIYQYKKNKLNRTTPLNNYPAIDCLSQEFNNLQPPLYAFANVKKIKKIAKRQKCKHQANVLACELTIQCDTIGEQSQYNQQHNSQVFYQNFTFISRKGEYCTFKAKLNEHSLQESFFPIKKILKSLKFKINPFIKQIYVQGNNSVYFYSQYSTKQSLKTFIKKYGSKLTLFFKIRILMKILSALCCLNTESISINSLSPQKIQMRGIDPIISDFSCAFKQKQQIKRGARAKLRSLCEPYVCPQILRYDIANHTYLLDCKADVFSFGHIMHYVLYGKILTYQKNQSSEKKQFRRNVLVFQEYQSLGPKCLIQNLNLIVLSCVNSQRSVRPQPQRLFESLYSICQKL